MQGILCVNHCGPRVFCFELPELCPACRGPLASANLLLPFRVPYPFSNAGQYPFSVVIKPTRGDFIQDFKIGDDLHIGVTSSRGLIFEFDSEGLHTDRVSSWSQSLVIHSETSEEWTSIWDEILIKIASHESWTSTRYNEETYNCYTFVLAFLRCLGRGSLSECARSKILFCHTYVLPLVNKAFKYVLLHRRLCDIGYFVSRDRIL